MKCPHCNETIERRVTSFDAYVVTSNADYPIEAFGQVVRNAMRGLTTRSPEDTRQIFEAIEWVEAWLQGVRDASTPGPL